VQGAGAPTACVSAQRRRGGSAVGAGSVRCLPRDLRGPAGIGRREPRREPGGPVRFPGHAAATPRGSRSAPAPWIRATRVSFVVGRIAREASRSGSPRCRSGPSASWSRWSTRIRYNMVMSLRQSGSAVVRRPGATYHIATGPCALRFLPRRIVALWGHRREREERTAGCGGHYVERDARDLARHTTTIGVPCV